MSEQTWSSIVQHPVGRGVQNDQREPTDPTLVEPGPAPAAAEADEEYQPDPARPDLVGEADEADVAEQAIEVPIDEDEALSRD